MLLTADLLLNYQRCSRRAFLDLYGDLNQRDAPNDYLLKLIQDSIANHQQILTGETYQKPSYRSGDWAAGAAATIELMRQGIDQIYQPVLLSEQDGVTLISVPDLLTKQPGESVFGDWIYVPTEIKLSKRPKQEYQIIVAYHVKVLAAVQEAWCETAWLLLRGKGFYEVDLWEAIPRMETILEECLATLKQADQEPEVFISRSRCSLCHWYGQCYAIAKADQHLSLLARCHAQSLSSTPNTQSDHVRIAGRSSPKQARTPARIWWRGGSKVSPSGSIHHSKSRFVRGELRRFARFRTAKRTQANSSPLRFLYSDCADRALF